MNADRTVYRCIPTVEGSERDAIERKLRAAHVRVEMVPGGWRLVYDPSDVEAIVAIRTLQQSGKLIEQA